MASSPVISRPGTVGTSPATQIIMQVRAPIGYQIRRSKLNVLFQMEDAMSRVKG